MAEMSVLLRDVSWARVRADGNLKRAHISSGLGANEQIHLLWTCVSQETCREDLKSMIQNSDDLVETMPPIECAVAFENNVTISTTTGISWGITRKMHTHT